MAPATMIAISPGAMSHQRVLIFDASFQPNGSVNCSQGVIMLIECFRVADFNFVVASLCREIIKSSLIAEAITFLDYCKVAISGPKHAITVCSNGRLSTTMSGIRR